MDAVLNPEDVKNLEGRGHDHGCDVVQVLASGFRLTAAGA
jgi:hypothetical protein